MENILELQQIYEATSGLDPVMRDEILDVFLEFVLPFYFPYSIFAVGKEVMRF